MLVVLACACVCCPERPLLRLTSGMGNDPLAGRFVPAPVPTWLKDDPALPTPFPDDSNIAAALGSLEWVAAALVEGAPASCSDRGASAVAAVPFELGAFDDGDVPKAVGAATTRSFSDSSSSEELPYPSRPNMTASKAGHPSFPKRKGSMYAVGDLSRKVREN